MSVTFSWSAPIDTPDNATVVVRHALLPMLLWPSVPVVREIRQEFTVIDRFLVEAAMMTAPEPVASADIAEVTGVPRDAVDRIAGRLVALGLLVPADAGPGAGFAPTAAAATALERTSVTRRQETRLTFLYLPQGDDLVAYQDGPRRVEPPMLHRMTPESVFPLPSEVAALTFAGFLRERISDGRVAGLPEGIVDVVDDEHQMPLGCPVYRCTGTVVERDDEVELRLRTVGTNRKQRAYRIAGAAGQAAHWSARVGWPDAVAGWTETGGKAEMVRVGPTSWSLTVDGPAAEVAASGIVDLSRPAGLSMTSDDCVTYVDVSFGPADHAARRVFARQDALLRITATVTDELSEAAVSEAASAARAAYGLAEADLTEQAVHDRLWLDGHYLHVYALRKDFDGYG